MRILHNRIRCLHCNKILESKSVHDFVMCECGKCFTDGGHEYLRRGGERGVDWEELVEYVNRGEDDA